MHQTPEKNTQSICIEFVFLMLGSSRKLKLEKKSLKETEKVK